MTVEVVNEESKKKERPRNELESLIPLGMEYIQNSQRQAEIQNNIQKEQIKLNEKHLNTQESVFRHKFWLLVFITASIVGISAGLIFIKNDTEGGLSILSHVGAVIVGIIAGSGWQQIKSQQ